MIPHVTGEQTALKCTVPFSAEFPEILTVTTDDDGITYFDATAYLETKKDKNLSVDKFFYHFRYLHYNMLQRYGLDAKKTVLVDRSSHILIDARFVFLFISYVEPDFLLYINGVLTELFGDGIVLSERYIAQLAKERLPQDVLMMLANEPDSGTDGGAEGGAVPSDAAGPDV